MLDSLLRENSRIFTLLPALGTGLLTRQNSVDSVYACIDSHLKRKGRDEEPLTKIKQQIQQLEEQGNLKEQVLLVDEDKTIMLAYAFGEIYSLALALAIDGIHLQVLNQLTMSIEELKKIAREYLQADGDDKVPVFAKVLSMPRKVVAPPPPEQNVYLQLRQLLSKMGYTITLDTLEVLRYQQVQNTSELLQKEYVELETVDLYNWACTCSAFVSSYNQVPSSTSPQVVEGFHDSLLLRYFMARQSSKQLSPLPICQHILALVLAALNEDNVDIEVNQIFDPSEI